MSILDKITKFKKGKKEDRTEKIVEEGKEKKEQTEKKEKISKEKPFSYSSVLQKPWVSEKSRGLSEYGKYVFLVDRKANKNLIKKEVERRWGVKVKSVNIINQKERPNRYGLKVGKGKRIKKAVVSLVSGNKIDIYSV